MKADTAGVAVLQVQANVQTVLEALGLVENKTAKQDAAALKEVSLRHACQRHAVQSPGHVCLVLCHIDMLYSGCCVRSGHCVLLPPMKCFVACRCNLY